MQNVWRLSNRNMFRYKVNFLNYLHKHLTNGNQSFRQYLKHDQICSCFGLVSQNTIRLFQTKYKTIHSILVHNYLFETSTIYEHNHNQYFNNQSSKKLNQNNANDSNNSSFNKNKKKKSSDQEKEEKLVKLKMLIALTLVYSFTAITISFIASNTLVKKNELSRVLSWNEFLHQFLSKGEVKEIVIIPEIDVVRIRVHDNAIINGQENRSTFYFMYLPDVIKVEGRIREAERKLGIKPEFGVPITYERSHFPGFFIILLAMSIALLWGIMRRLPKLRELPPKFYNHITRANFTLVDPLTEKGRGIKFADVAGLREAKIEVMEFVDYLKNPDHYKSLGAKLPKGILLLGPPGCGKTLLAKAVATEANVPFLSMNGSEFTEIIGGLGAVRIRNLFIEAKKRAPSIIYIDEIDTIGRQRLDSHFSRSTDESEQTLNQLLTEMDGMSTKQDIIVLASTNRSEVLDKALLRPGRLDRHILIDYPDLQDRKEIFELYLKKINLNHNPSDHSEKLASMTPKFTGADIANVCNEAALHAARLMKTQVESDDLLWATERMLNGSEKRNSTIMKNEKRIIAYHEAGHALIGWILETMNDIYKVSIIQRTNDKIGMITFREKCERNIYGIDELENEICYYLAGRVAENLIFNINTTHAKEDLENVKEMVYHLICEMGMSKALGLMTFLKQDQSNNRRMYSKKTSNMIDEEARLIIAKLYKRTEKLLIENKDRLKLLAESLMDKESLTYEQLKELIGPRHNKRNISEITV